MVVHFDIQKNFAKAMKAEGLNLKEHRIAGKYLGFCVETDGSDDREYLEDIFKDFPIKQDKVGGKFRYYPDKSVSEFEMEELYDIFLL